MEPRDFGVMNRREPPKNDPPAPRQFHSNNPSILGDHLLCDESLTPRSLDQANDCVVPLLQEFGKLGNRRPSPAGESRHAEHQLVLLRRHSCPARGSLAESEKLSKLIAEPRQLFDPSSGWAAFPGGRILHERHYITMRYLVPLKKQSSWRRLSNFRSAQERFQLHAHVRRDVAILHDNGRVERQVPLLPRAA